MLKRLDNIDVYCARLEPMVDFYRDTLRLPFALPYQPQERWAGFTAGDVTIYLIETTEGMPGAPRVPGGSPGLDSFAFEVDDLDEAIAELDRRCVSWVGDIVESPWYRYRGFHDPEGNLIYITRPDDRALGRA